MTDAIIANLKKAVFDRTDTTIGGGVFKPSEIKDFLDILQLREESRNKGWAVAKSLQAQVNILLPVVWAAADDDDEYGIGPKARKALEALAAHKET